MGQPNYLLKEARENAGLLQLEIAHKRINAKRMIIAASYETDIPTFYGEWFMNRLRAGYCKMVNPSKSVSSD